MFSRWRLLFLVLVLCMLLPQPSPAPLVYRPDEGWVYESDEETVEDAGDAEAQMELAREAEEAGDLSEALGHYRKTVRRFPASSAAPAAQLKVAQLYEKSGDFGRAFNAYQKLIENYPKSGDFNTAVEGQYDIANLFLEGERQRLLGVPTLPSMARAREMFQQVIQNAPFSKFAPLAQFRIGQAYEKEGDAAQAVRAYQTVIDKYPASDLTDDAQYQIGYVYMQEARQGTYDTTIANRARDSFQEFVLRYPESEKVDQAERNLDLLEKRQTAGALEVAQFYDKQKQYKAAVLYYQDVIDQQPDSPESDLATERIEEIRAMVGDEALQIGQERAETGARSRIRRRMQAQVDTAARPDYVGPPAPPVPDEVPPEEPKLRTSPEDIGPFPVVEPELPTE